ncbi:MAG: DUF192 domain-containing protein [Thermoleophilia bacterium]|nr:DUF192 domain-containing protein [Thermoleophilia bacterium]
MIRKAAGSRPFGVPGAFILAASAVLLLSGPACGGQTESSSATGRADDYETPKALFFPGSGSEEDSEEAVEAAAGAASEIVVYLEVARTQQEKTQGLMNRDYLAPDHGMVFIYDHPVRGSFWMKNTFIPLSIAFISGSGVILDIQDMEPHSLNPHQPAEAYMYAVEMNQGFFAEKGIGVGDRVRFESIDPAS